MNSKPRSVQEYIASYSKESQKKQKEMRALLKKAAPNALESLKRNAPFLSYSRILFTYAAAYKNHIGLYPTPGPLKKFAKELAQFKTGKGSVRFPLDRPLPKALISKIAEYRAKEVRENNSRWM